MDLSGKISKLCKENGITLSALENELGLGNGTITRWNQNSPSIEKVRKVAHYFGVSVDFLLSYDDALVNVTTPIELEQKLEMINTLHRFMANNITDLSSEDMKEIYNFMQFKRLEATKKNG
ncbi:MAG: helix-turn-helix transcriptional regulator [Defluviitaleaceae bacterium]|nr:helix-turn-helix transcriptional regulator [Defluviitaleaceae bacterium]